MKKILLVFIDGLQYNVAVKNMNIFKNAQNSSVTPGIGFSNNIYPEILCGKNPDGMGYFNEWSPVKDNKQKLPFYFRLLDIFRWSLYINAGIRKIILRKLFKLDYSNIPFKYAHYFKAQGSHDFKDLNCGVIKDYDFELFDSVDSKLGVGNRDSEILNIVDNEIKEKNLFISLIDLDNIAHIYGQESHEFSKHIKYLDNRLKNIFKKFKDVNPNSEIFVFSDHGMVDVSETVKFDLEKEFGVMNKDTYLYFLDSTYLRIWIKDKAKIEQYKDYLNSLSFGELLSDDVRQEFGLTNKDFGDIIFRAKEGIMFAPNFYGGRPVKAMHGYDSYLESQQAIFSKIDSEKNESLPTTSKAIYSYLKRACSEK